MKLASPHKSRERMLVYGGYGAGKTWNWMNWAKHTTGRIWVVDTDQTVLPFLESDEFAELEDRMEFIEPFEWPEYVEFTDKARKEGDRDDLLVIDMMNAPWNEVQNYFSDQVFGKELGDFWLQYRKEVEAAGRGSKSAFDGTTDWQAIKKMYAQFTGRLMRFPGHLYLCAPEKQIGPFDGSEIQTQYSQAGNMKPDCEKSTGHMTRTVLRMSRQRATTVKDRQREELEGVKIKSFATDYLLKVAGWKPVKE